MLTALVVPITYFSNRIETLHGVLLSFGASLVSR